MIPLILRTGVTRKQRLSRKENRIIFAIQRTDSLILEIRGSIAFHPGYA